MKETVFSFCCLGHAQGVGLWGAGCVQVVKKFIFSNMVMWHIKLTRMTSRTECSKNFILGSNWWPWGEVKGQISLNFGYHVSFKDFYTKLCVCSHKWKIQNTDSKSTGLQIYGGPGSLSHDFKIWLITFQGSGSSGPILFSCEKSHYKKNIHLTASLQTPENSCQYSKTCLKQPLKKKDKTKIFITNGSLMKRIAECAFCNTYDLHLAKIGLPL